MFDEDLEEKKELAERLNEIPEKVIELINEATEIIDEIGSKEVKERWKAYVPGNLFAEEFGYLGKAGGDYMIELIDDVKSKILTKKEKI